MRIRNTVAVAVLALAATSTAGVGLAAAEAPHPAPAPAACSGPTPKAAEAIKVRAKPTTHSTAVGRLDKGERTCVLGSTTGEKYHACGLTQNYWTEIKYAGHKRYVPNACLEE